MSMTERSRPSDEDSQRYIEIWPEMLLIKGLGLHQIRKVKAFDGK